jgi:hypothetical protein
MRMSEFARNAATSTPHSLPARTTPQKRPLETALQKHRLPAMSGSIMFPDGLRNNVEEQQLHPSIVGWTTSHWGPSATPKRTKKVKHPKERRISLLIEGALFYYLLS